MLSLKKGLQVLCAVAAVSAVGAVAVSPAMASVVPAKFSSNSLKLTTSGITLTNRTEKKTCTLVNSTAHIVEPSIAAWENFGEMRWKCPDLNNQLNANGLIEPLYDSVTGKYSLNFRGLSFPESSFWGWYEPEEFTATWTNGSGLTNSTIKFENATIGYRQSDRTPLIFNGTLTATTSTGGLLTLSH